MPSMRKSVRSSTRQWQRRVQRRPLWRMTLPPMCTRPTERSVTMSKKSFRQALNEAMRQEMERDPTVIALGEDIAGGMGSKGQQDAWGDVLGASKGLMPEFGRDRIFDTPISESAFI